MSNDQKKPGDYGYGTLQRMAPGGDLYVRPLSRAEMTAPLKWFERQMAVVHRYGMRADGTIGYERVFSAAGPAKRKAVRRG